MRLLIKSILLWLALAFVAAGPAHALLPPPQAEFGGCYTPKYRVMGYAENASGRFTFCAELKRQLAMGCDVRGEEIASGQGKFLSADPLGHAASMDLYSYCNGDPVNGLDPDGRIGKNAIEDVGNAFSSLIPTDYENGPSQFTSGNTS